MNNNKVLRVVKRKNKKTKIKIRKKKMFLKLLKIKRNKLNK